jgi:hypothetical protein
LLAALYDFLLSDLLFIQNELNMLFQTTNTPEIQLVPNLKGLPQQQALGVLLQQWEWVEQLLSE